MLFTTSDMGAKSRSVSYGTFMSSGLMTAPAEEASSSV